MISRAILATFTYSDHFGFPLTLAELHQRLISSEPCSLEKVFGTLQSMLEQKLVQQTGEYFHLPTRSTLVARRLHRAQLSLAPQARARKLATRLSRAPGVLAIYLTGSLAVSNSRADSDIDLMIITEPGRLWTTRLLLTLYTTIRGWRRHAPNVAHRAKWGHPQSIAGKLCLNLYLTLDSFTLPPSRQNLYTAYELIQAVPLYDPHHTHPALLSANSWLRDYLPNYPSGPGPVGQGNLPTGPGPIGTLLEFLFYHLQLFHMRPKITRELVTPNSAFFHPRDPGAKILAKLALLK